MKRYRELDVNLVNLDNFEFYPGAQEFNDEFADFSISRLRFRFEDFAKLEEARNKLSQLDLTYTEFYGITLESDEELEKYPVILLSFNTQYQLMKANNGNSSVNEKSANSAFNKDVRTGKLIVTEKARAFLEKELPALEYEQLMSKSKKEYFELLKLKSMLHPEIVKDNRDIREIAINDQLFYQKNVSDGRMIFSKESFDEIRQNRFMTMKSFLFLGKIYETPKFVFVASGEFVVKLKNEFDFSKENISFFVPEIDLV